MSTTPDELCEAFEQGIKGQADIDVAEVVDAIIMDIIDSAALAAKRQAEEAAGAAGFSRLSIENAGDDAARAVRLTTEDYYGNAYGEL